MTITTQTRDIYIYIKKKKSYNNICENVIEFIIIWLNSGSQNNFVGTMVRRYIYIIIMIYMTRTRLVFVILTLKISEINQFPSMLIHSHRYQQTLNININISASMIYTHQSLIYNTQIYLHFI